MKMANAHEIQDKLRASRQRRPLNSLVSELLKNPRFHGKTLLHAEISKEAWAALVGKPSEHAAAAHMDLHQEYSKALGIPVSNWRNYSWTELNNVTKGNSGNKELNRVCNEFKAQVAKTLHSLQTKKALTKVGGLELFVVNPENLPK